MKPLHTLQAFAIMSLSFLCASASAAVISGDWQGSGGEGDSMFGGPPYCNYFVRLKVDSIELSLENGSLYRSALTATMREEAPKDCPTPLGTKTLQFTGNLAFLDDQRIVVAFFPAPDNEPQTLGKLEGSILNGTIIGTLTMIRTDQPRPLAWRIDNLPVTLQRKQ